MPSGKRNRAGWHTGTKEPASLSAPRTARHWSHAAHKKPRLVARSLCAFVIRDANPVPVVCRHDKGTYRSTEMQEKNAEPQVGYAIGRCGCQSISVLYRISCVAVNVCMGGFAALVVLCCPRKRSTSDLPPSRIRSTFGLAITSCSGKSSSSFSVRRILGLHNRNTINIP